jgi:hypothetical protein
MASLSTHSLQVYPGGVEDGIGTHLSVFLELLDAPPREAFSSPPRHAWRVEMARPGPARETMARPHARDGVCEFETGECWG